MDDKTSMWKGNPSPIMIVVIDDVRDDIRWWRHDDGAFKHWCPCTVLEQIKQELRLDNHCRKSLFLVSHCWLMMYTWWWRNGWCCRVLWRTSWRRLLFMVYWFMTSWFQCCRRNPSHTQTLVLLRIVQNCVSLYMTVWHYVWTGRPLVTRRTLKKCKILCFAFILIVDINVKSRKYIKLTIVYC